MRAKSLPKIGEKREKTGKVGGKLGKMRKNWEDRQKLGDSFTFPLLTDRVGHATAKY